MPTRRQRQQNEILEAALEGRLRHALDLAFQHFDEFGPDPLVVDTFRRVMASLAESWEDLLGE